MIRHTAMRTIGKAFHAILFVWRFIATGHAKTATPFVAITMSNNETTLVVTASIVRANNEILFATFTLCHRLASAGVRPA
jgi:hypothetical protein